MRPVKTSILAAIIAATLLGGASLATSEETQRANDAPMASDPKTIPKEPGKAMGMMGDRMMANCPMMGGTPKAADAIKTELGITDAQKSVWEGFVVAQLKAKVGMQEVQQAMKSMMDAKSPVERLDARLAALELHLNSVREFKIPLEALYGALSPEQRKKADTLLADVACGM